VVSNKFTIPVRVGPAPKVGLKPPQLQFSDLGPENIRAALKQWAFISFPNVREHDTLISVPATRAMWLDEAIEQAHEDAFMPPAGSREFCHLHEDGSLHLVLGSEVEQEIIDQKWGIRHMYYDRGVKEILLYAPRNEDELRTVKRIVVESYKYASGDLNTEIPF
jgi:hypothetical protein